MKMGFTTGNLSEFDWFEYSKDKEQTPSMCGACSKKPRTVKGRGFVLNWEC